MGVFVYSYHLFLVGHIKEVDSDTGNHIQYIDEFYATAKAGTLPTFRHGECSWVGNSSGSVPYSCHPPSDLEPGLKLIADIYNALREGPDFEHTLF